MSVLSRLKTFIMRKHLVLFGIILAAGLSMIVVGTMMGIGALSTPDNPVLAQLLITEGVAFVVIGLVGILMSWTTFDIGTNIKEVVREVGKQNKETLDLLLQSQERTSQSLDRIAQSQERIEQSQERTSQSMDKIADLLAQVVKNTTRTD